jgi:phage terminase large subunit-like protein
MAIDPAVSTRRGTDRTGIMRVGLGVDRQVYICRDYSGKHRPEEWAKIVVDEWLAEPEIDCVVVERNKGGELVASVLRLYAASRGISVVVLGPDERPTRRPGVLYVKEVYARGKKADRAQPLATAYERGRVSHVIGENLAQFEETLTTWEPREGADSPDDLDAAVHAVCELLGLGNTETDGRAMVAGLSNVTRQLVAARPASAGNLAALLGGGRAGRGI